MIEVDQQLQPADLLAAIERMWEASADRLRRIEDRWEFGSPSPVFTAAGKYQAQGWTEWTQGFQFGSLVLQFDATGDLSFLEVAREQIVAAMAPHVTHVGVHDHGFNNVSTYGALLRLMNEGRIEENAWERNFYELALKASGAVQAARWARTADGGGYIYSFNGPQSLFVDTIRSCRALALAHQLGHSLMGERDERIRLFARLVQHAEATARFNVYYGEGRDEYDVRGRTAHESLFNANNGDYRCPSTQQGYSPFSTWTRGLAWAMLGFSELLEWLPTRSDEEFVGASGSLATSATAGANEASDAAELARVRASIERTFVSAARATCDFYIDQTPSCGVPYWDTGAPGLARMGDYLNRPADPFNDYEPVDSSAAAIAAQGLLRLAHVLSERGEAACADRYKAAGLTALKTLLDEPYLSTDSEHEGLLLHTVYHRPRGWDYVPPGRTVPCGEACMWGDYHLREVCLYVQRQARDQPYYAFFGPPRSQEPR